MEPLGHETRQGRHARERVWATWKSLVLIRVERLRTELELTRAMAVEKAEWPFAPSVYTRVGELLSDAEEAARTPWWRNLLTWLTGAEIERAWAALHDADELLYLVRDLATLRALRAELLAAVQSRIGEKDPRRTVFTQALKPDDESVDPMMLRQIRRNLNEISDDAHGRLRNFRNVVLALTVILSIGMGLLAADAPSQPWLPITHGKPPFPTIWQVVLVGALGGLLAGVVALRDLEGFAGPYGLPIVMAVLKIPAGALTGLLGALWMQNAVLAILSPQDGLRILAYVALFGYAQQALTSLADKQASELLGQAKGGQSATGGGAAP